MAASKSVLWTDAHGGVSITRLRTIDDTLVTPDQSATIVTQLLALANSDYIAYWQSNETANGAPSPVVGDYISVADRAELLFLCADNTIATVQIVAPKAADFLADGQTVDSTAVAALITACVGVLVSGSGSAAVSYIGGTRKRV